LSAANVLPLYCGAHINRSLCLAAAGRRRSSGKLGIIRLKPTMSPSMELNDEAGY
jgi:hypothetical protein